MPCRGDITAREVMFRTAGGDGPARRERSAALTTTLLIAFPVWHRLPAATGRPAATRPIGARRRRRRAHAAEPSSISSTPTAIAASPTPMTALSGSKNRIRLSTAVSATPTAAQIP